VDDIGLPSTLLGFVCVLLTGMLWTVTLTNPTPAPIGAELALTAIAGLMVVFHHVGKGRTAIAETLGGYAKFFPD
jgi:hypothetical protein